MHGGVRGGRKSLLLDFSFLFSNNINKDISF